MTIHLVDSHVLLRLTDVTHPHHAQARRQVAQLRGDQHALVIDYRVSGVQVHDARLVAAMLAHGVTHILTFNTADFARYAPEGIVAVAPASEGRD